MLKCVTFSRFIIRFCWLVSSNDDKCSRHSLAQLISISSPIQMFPHEMQQLMSNGSDPLFHADTIHHVEFDFYGQRVVTASSDKMVCIWDRDQQGSWRKSASWKKHGGAIWRARFAHPEYGQVLATCSFDNTIQIYDKDAADMLDTRTMGGSDNSNGWVCRVVLRQSTASITDIQFAPHYLGLQLAACTSSGRIIIYEAEDIMALDNWNVLYDEEVASHRLSSLSWSLNRFDPPYIAASSDDVDAPADEKLFIFLFNPNTGLIRSQLRNPPGHNSKDQHQQQQRLFHFDEQLSMVSFGPTCGLASHKLAVAVGPRIHIYQLLAESSASPAGGDNGAGSAGLDQPQQSSSIGTLIEHGWSASAHAQQDFLLKGFDVLEEGPAQVVRFSWNLLGDVLSAVHADGLVCIWKYISGNRWTPVSAITPPAELDRATKDDVYY